MTCSHRPLLVLPDASLSVAKACVTIRCTACGELLSLGAATPPPSHEFALAVVLADVHRLWEPGEERNRRIAWTLEAFAK